MLKTRFEAQQYLIRQAEIKLHNDTQILLTEMLRSLSKENLSKLDGFELDNCGDLIYIEKVEINTDSIIFVVKDWHVTRNSIDYLPQIQQKDLIDFIIENNLVNN
jgi:hypothetical protein